MSPLQAAQSMSGFAQHFQLPACCKTEIDVTGSVACCRFVASHPLVASTVVGASCMEQLDEVLAAGETPWLDSTVRHAVNAVHQRYPNPCP